MMRNSRVVLALACFAFMSAGVVARAQSTDGSQAPGAILQDGKGAIPGALDSIFNPNGLNGAPGGMIDYKSSSVYELETNASTYVLGAGDVLFVSVWGKYSFTGNYSVAIDGQLMTESEQTDPLQMGNISVTDLTVREASDRIREHLKKLLKVEFSLDVLLRRSRMINVFILGQAARPGSYMVPANRLAVDAIRSLGGPNAHGSYREIELHRSGESDVRKIDVLKYYYLADFSQNPVLKNGDVLFVPFKKRHVGITGYVKSAGMYELREGEGMKELLAFCGGFRAGAIPESSRVERMDNAGNKNQLPVDISGGDAAFELKDGDVVQVPLFNNIVYIFGAVSQPTGLAYRAGLNLNDYLLQVGGPLRNAKINTITILRIVNNKPRNLVVNYGRFLKTGVWDNEVGIMPGDIIIVPTDTRLKTMDVVNYIQTFYPFLTLMKVIR